MEKQASRLIKSFKITIWDYIIFGAFVALVWGKSAQTILLAAIAFLLYLLVRSQLSKTTTNLSSVSDDNDFVVDKDEYGWSQVELDTDIDYQQRKNHFRFDSRFDTVRRDGEFEYKVGGTKVFTRLLHESLEDIGMAKTWEVRDGVFLESEFRERVKSEKSVLFRKCEEEIADRKRALEWHEMLSSHWNGLKYFILLKNLPKDDARRFFRQEIERLKLGSNRYIEEATKIGFIHDETSHWRIQVPEGMNPSEEQRQKLADTLTASGISHDEFMMAPRLIAALEKYVA